MRALRTWRLVSVLVPLALFVAAAWYDHVIILRSAHERLLSSADALAAHAQTVLETASLALSLQLHAVGGMDWDTIDHSLAVHRFLARLKEQLPELESAFFVDPDGFNSASSRNFPMRRFDDRKREYYVASKAGEAGMVVSAPFHGAVDGEPGFTVSRARIVNGKFDGVAAVTLAPSYFRGVYRDVLRWPDSSAALLVRRDGVVLARYPPIQGVLDRLPLDTDTMRAAASGRDVVYRPVSIVDSRPKLAAIRWLPGHRVMVVAALDLTRTLQPWYLHVAMLAGFALLAAAALWITGGVALRRTEREQQSLRALYAETARRQETEAALSQAQKLDALGRLTGGVAHDFNNLLTAVMGSLELALRRVSDPPVQRLLQSARAAAERGARLTAHMLAFARKQPLSLQAFDANAVVRGTDELLRRSAESMIRLRYDLADAVWPVLSDPMQLEVALLNLVVNARDAMPDGGEVCISVRNLPAAEAMRLGLEGRDFVAITVADTGEGMSEAVRASAFEPFFTTKEPGRGTGLGLSMVYGFARQAGGMVAIDSAPGKGTTVTIHLPRAQAPSEAPASGADAVTPLPGLRVMLVDDDSAAREPTAALLRELGCTVTEADSAAVALDRLHAGEAFDVLLLDFAMPEMNGGRLAATARDIRPDLPVVFLTGYADTGLLQDWQRLGIQVVSKPFRLETLSTVLHRIRMAA